tara:strand:+ start:6906 stop:8117 length:1212 start_codon:yes stop_codon:yes gene_type:complete
LGAFNYIALDKKGKKESGTLSADNLDIARRELISRDLSPVNIEEINSKSIFNKLKSKKITDKSLIKISRQLSALLNGGLPLETALSSIGKESKSDVEKEQLLKISSSLQEGRSFSDALREYPQSFSNLFVSLISAGENSGNLSTALQNLSIYIEKKEKIRNEVIGALVYPSILILVALLIVTLLLIFVVPNVVEQFSGLNQELPFLTLALISISNFIISPIFISLITISLCIALYIRIYFRQKFKLKLDAFLLKLPYFNHFLIQSDISKFLSSMSLLRNGGITIVNSINISIETISNGYLRKEFSDKLVKVEEGATLTDSLKEIPLIPSLVIQMISSGEMGGDLEQMLSKTSDFLDQEFQQSSKLMISLLEPLIVVIMGGVVATIIIAILLPLIQMNNLSIIS